MIFHDNSLYSGVQKDRIPYQLQLNQEPHWKIQRSMFRTETYLVKNAPIHKTRSNNWQHGKSSGVFRYRSYKTLRRPEHWSNFPKSCIFPQHWHIQTNKMKLTWIGMPYRSVCILISLHNCFLPKRKAHTQRSIIGTIALHSWIYYDNLWHTSIIQHLTEICQTRTPPTVKSRSW